MRYSWHASGYSGGLHNIQMSISAVKDKINAFQNTISNFGYFQTIQNYVAKVTDVNLTVYTQFQNQTQLLTKLTTFYQDTKNVIDTFQQIRTSFVDAKTNIGAAFIQGADIATNVTLSVESVNAWMNNMCTKNGSFQLEIDSVKLSLTTLRDSIDTAIGNNAVMR